MGALTSQNPIGLHGLLEEYINPFISDLLSFNGIRRGNYRENLTVKNFKLLYFSAQFV
jgi:hypothetical protein